METPAPNQRRKTRATKKTTERGGSLGESEAEEKTEAQGGDGTNGKGDERKSEGGGRRERKKRTEEKKKKTTEKKRRGEYDEGFRGKGGKNPVGARFTTMQLDRAFTSFLFERVSTYRNGVRYSDVERRIVFRTVKWKQKAT